jgi:hypothetical protein
VQGGAAAWGSLALAATHLSRGEGVVLNQDDEREIAMSRYKTETDEKTRRAILAMKDVADNWQSPLEQDCQAYIDGKIKTQAEIARKYGVTGACISKRVQNMRPIDPRAVDQFCKDHIRKTYGLRQMIVMAARLRQTAKTKLQKETAQLWTEACHD